MSLLDDVRKMQCCGGAVESDHRGELCLDRMNPRIVAALEAAERWEAAEKTVSDYQAQGDHDGQYIPSPLYRERDSARSALVAALKGGEPA